MVPSLAATSGLGAAAQVTEAAGVRSIHTLDTVDGLASTGDATLLDGRGDASMRASVAKGVSWCDNPPSDDGDGREASSSTPVDAEPSLAGELFPELSESDDEDREVDTSSCRRDGVAPARSPSLTGVGRDAMAAGATTAWDALYGVAVAVGSAQLRLVQPGARVVVS